MTTGNEQFKAGDSDFFSDVELEIAPLPGERLSAIAVVKNALDKLSSKEPTPEDLIGMLIDSRTPGCMDPTNEIHKAIIQQREEKGQPVPEECLKAPIHLKPISD